MCDFYRNILREYDFWPFLGQNFKKIRVPSENIDFFPSIDIYRSDLSIVKVDLAKADIWNIGIDPYDLERPIKLDPQL